MQIWQRSDHFIFTSYLLLKDPMVNEAGMDLLRGSMSNSLSLSYLAVK